MLRCKQHPTYKGKRKPRLACEECWAIYFGIHKRAPWLAIKTNNNDSDETTD